MENLPGWQSNTDIYSLVEYRKHIWMFLGV